MAYCNQCDGEGGRTSRMPGRGFVKCAGCDGRGTDAPGVLSDKVLIRMGEEARQDDATRAPAPSMRANVVRLGQERADRANSAAKWTPREALQSALDMIERGDVNPSSICIVFKTENGKRDGGDKPSYLLAGVTDSDTMCGALANVIRRIMVAHEDD